MSTIAIQTTQSDEQLMAAYGAGDERACAELYRRYSTRLTSFFMRRGKARHEADDLLQQTFLQLHRARTDYRAGELVSPWIFTIARNAGHDHGRRRQRRPETFCDFFDHAAPEPEADAVIHEERARILAQALDALPGPQRALLHDHYFQERSWTELAVHTGALPGTLRVRAHRSCQLLRELIGRESIAAA
jgi:RNA polymerase sigma-70 factor (ECF subfamily)